VCNSAVIISVPGHLYVSPISPGRAPAEGKKENNNKLSSAATAQNASSGFSKNLADIKNDLLRG